MVAKGESWIGGGVGICESDLRSDLRAIGS